MKTKDKLVVGFVWGIIIFETTCFLSIMAPLFYTHDPIKFWLVIPVFVLIVSLLIISYYKSTTVSPGSPSVHVNIHYNEEI